MTKRVAPLVMALLAIACEPAPQIGATCMRTSECVSPLACIYGRCRVECAESRDCSPGLRCIEAAGGGACTLEVEERCTDTICQAPLRCVANQCRTGCTSDDECVEGACVMGTCVEPASGVDAGAPEDADVDAGVVVAPIHVTDQCDTSGFAQQAGLARTILGDARLGGGVAGIELLASASSAAFATPAEGTTSVPGQVAIAARPDATDGNLWVAWIQQIGGVPTGQLVDVPIGDLSDRSAPHPEFAIANARWIDLAVDGSDFLGVVTLPLPSAGAARAWVVDPARRFSAPGEIVSGPVPEDQIARSVIVGGRSPFAPAGSPPVWVFREETTDGVRNLGSVDRELRGGEYYFSIDTTGIADTAALETAGGAAPLWVARDPVSQDIVVWDQRRRPASDPPFVHSSLVSLGVTATGTPSVAARADDPTRAMIAYPSGAVTTFQEVTCPASAACTLGESADLGSISGAPVTRVSIAAVAEGFVVAMLEEVAAGVAVITFRYVSVDGALVGDFATGATLPRVFDGRTELAAGEQVVDMRVVATPAEDGAAMVLAVLVRDEARDLDRVWLGGQFACVPSP